MNPDVVTPAIPGATQAVQHQWWEYGILAILCAAFAYVIVFLYKRGEKIREAHDAKIEAHNAKVEAERKAMEAERAEWALEREHWDLEREKIRAGFAERYAKDLREVMDFSRANEAVLRRENADMLETMSAESKRASDSLVAMLQKFHDRALSSKGR